MCGVMRLNLTRLSTDPSKTNSTNGRSDGKLDLPAPTNRDQHGYLKTPPPNDSLTPVIAGAAHLLVITSFHTCRSCSVPYLFLSLARSVSGNCRRPRKVLPSQTRKEAASSPTTESSMKTAQRRRSTRGSHVTWCIL